MVELHILGRIHEKNMEYTEDDLMNIYLKKYNPPAIPDMTRGFRVIVSGKDIVSEKSQYILKPLVCCNPDAIVIVGHDSFAVILKVGVIYGPPALL